MKNFIVSPKSEQIFKIFEMCGAPDESKWPEVKSLPWYTNFKPNRPLKRRLREHFRPVDRHALELLEKMLVLDPSQRISTLAALDAEYFWTDPLPCDPQSLPKYESSHEFLTKQKRQHHRHHEEAGKRLKFQHPPTQTRVLPMQQSGEAQNPIYSQRQAGSYQQQRRHEEAVKYEKVQDQPQHHAAYTHPLPNQQSSQAHARRLAGQNQPMHGSQVSTTTGPGHHHWNSQGSSRFSQGGNSGGHNLPDHVSHGGWRGHAGASYGQGPSHGSSSMRAPVHRGVGSGGLESARNYHQNSPNNGSSGGRSSKTSRRRNHQYGSRWAD